MATILQYNSRTRPELRVRVYTEVSLVQSCIAVTTNTQQLDALVGLRTALIDIYESHFSRRAVFNVNAQFCHDPDYFKFYAILTRLDMFYAKAITVTDEFARMEHETEFVNDMKRLRIKFTGLSTLIGLARGLVDMTFPIPEE